MDANAKRLVAALTATKFGDRVVDAKTVLPWLLASLGAPTALLGLLVPIRESGALLPQAALLPIVRTRARRSGLWLVGAAGQAIAAGVMAVTAVTLEGATAGAVVLLALAVFATARAVCSITAKDVMGRTITKGSRGRVTGTATTTAGIVTIVLGLGLRDVGADAPTWAFGALLGGGAAMWLLAMLPFAAIDEPAGDRDEEVDGGRILDALSLLRDDASFRRFVVARTLLLVSALSPPFVIALAQAELGAGIAGLGPFVIASGLAGLLGGRLWGEAADRSSRLVMVWGAAAASAVVLLFLVVRWAGALEASTLHLGTYALLALAHTAVRVGRKTYVVDLAEGNRRTDYVAVSNTAMGVLLLIVGGLTSALSALGPVPALVALAVIGAAAVPTTLSLPEVSAG